MASASASSSVRLSVPMDEARLSRSLSTVMFLSSSLTNFCMRSPDFTHEPFSMMAKVRFADSVPHIHEEVMHGGVDAEIVGLKLGQTM